MSRRDHRKSSDKVGKACVFCHLPDDNELKFGKIYEHNGIVTHYYCLLLSANMQQRGSDEEGILGFLTQDIQNELKRGKRLVCSYCKKAGATLGCCNTKCKKIFHYPCGLKAGSLHQFFGEFRSYCVLHRPRSKFEDRFRTELQKAIDESPHSSTCYICLENVDRSDKFQTLWAPCCKKNAWFHRDCIQQLAMSAGYFFKCPMCNNKKEFQKAMLDRGIFIPCQDASWELVPHAFEELLYRHNRCDARHCRCPKGREYTDENEKWELTLCRTCGSQGIHVACGKLEYMKPKWECGECISILKKSKADNVESSPNRNNSIDSTSNSTIPSNLISNNENENEPDIDDSDSDISVGVELPIFSELTPTTSANMRPGPRSFKQKQQEEIQKNSPEKNQGSTSNGFVGIRPDTDDSDSDEDVIVLDSDNETETNKKRENLKKSPPFILENNQSIAADESSASISKSPIENVISPKPTKEPSINFPGIISFDKSMGTPIICESISVQEFENPTPKTSFLRDILDPNSSSPYQPNNALQFSELNHQQPAPAIIVPLTVRENTTTDDVISSVMNIKITNVTSLPADVFDWGNEIETISDVNEMPEIIEKAENNQEASLPTESCRIPKPLKIGLIPETDSENEEITYQLRSTAFENKIRSLSLSKTMPETPAIGSTINNLPNVFIPSNNIKNSSNIEPQINKKRKLNNSTVNNGFRNPKNSKTERLNNENLGIYKNGVSLDNVAVVSVLGNDFVVPLDMRPTTSDGNFSNNMNYNGDAGTRNAVDICSEREITRCGDNRAKSGTDGVSDTDEYIQRHKPSTSSSFATESTSFNPTRIINETISLKDLKFRIGDQNNMEVTVCNSYVFNVTLNTIRSIKKIDNNPRQSRQFEESSLVREFSSSEKNHDLRSHQDLVNTLEDSKRPHLQKIENKDAVKENMAPAPILNDLIGRLPNLDKRSKRLRDSSNDSTNSDDGQKEFSHLLQNPKPVQKIPKHKKNHPKHQRRQSFNGFNRINDEDARLRVSIELSRIQTFLDSNPDLVHKHANVQDKNPLRQSTSMIDLNNYKSKDHLEPGLLRRVKSFENISSIPSSKKMNSRHSINSIESQEFGKRQKTINFEKHDCIR